MPGGLSGLELGRRLLAQQPGLRVLYSTGYTDELLGGASSLRGTTSFLEKPYDRRKLLSNVRACPEAADAIESEERLVRDADGGIRPDF